MSVPATEPVPDLTVVVPVYDNATRIPELAARLEQAVQSPYELLFVDDASADGARTVISKLAEKNPRITGIALAENVGQNSAVVAGLAHARGSAVAVMDGDLQDPPEAVPALLSALERYDVDAVFAVRRGRYESRMRLASGRMLKRVLWLLTAGKVPPDAGLFLVVRRQVAERIVAAAGSDPYVLVLVARAASSVATVPVERGRGSGSSYTSQMRIKVALRALANALRLDFGRSTYEVAEHIGGRFAVEDPRMKREAIERHNLAQQEYFEQRVPGTMIPRATPYVRRHVDELLSATGLDARASVLEVGCGMGNYTFELVRRGLALEGLDLSPVLLDRLRAYAADEVALSLHCADVLDPPEDLLGRFDGVVGFFTLHHLHDVEGSIASMARMLAPRGRLAFVEPNAFNPLYYVQIAATPGMSFRGERRLTSMRPAVILPALEAAGLSDVQVRRYGFFPPFLANGEKGRAVEQALERVRVLRPISAFQLFLGRRA